MCYNAGSWETTYCSFKPLYIYKRLVIFVLFKSFVSQAFTLFLKNSQDYFGEVQFMKVSSRFQDSRVVRLLVVVGMLAAVVQQLTLTTVSAAPLAAQLQQPQVAANAFTQQTTLTHKGSLISPLNVGQTLSMVVSLKEQDSAAFSQFLTDIQDPASANYHHFLTTAEYGVRFAPTAQTRQQVADYLTAQGFKITANNQGSSSISFRGTVAQAQKAFNVQLGNYQRPDGTAFYANDRTPAISSAFASKVVDVFGLSSEAQAHSNAKGKTDSTGKLAPHRGPQGSGFTPVELRKGYDIPDSYTGTGRKIGLYELGGYNPQNIDVYDQTFNLPAGNRVDVGIDSQSCTANDGDVQVEVELDIEIVNAIAPASQVYVYCGGPYAGNTLANGLDVYARIATDNAVDVVSESYGFGSELLEFGLGSFLEAEANYLRQIAAQGISFFASAGDSGANGGDGTPQVPEDPATQPYLTSVGGTRLIINGNNNSTVSYNTESVWNTGVQNAAGGGISNYFSKNTAPWQQGPGVNNPYSAANPGRQYPDVSANADPTSGYAVYSYDTTHGTNWYTYGGTSTSSPFWAAVAVDAVAVKGGRLGLLNPALYALLQNSSKYSADFHDITKGNNDTICVAGQSCQDLNDGGPFYPATPGYDVASGIGSPIVSKFIPDLVAGATPGPYLATNSVVKIGADINTGASKVISLTTYGNPVTVNYTSVVSGNISLTVSPATGSVTAGSATNVTLSVPPTAAAGTYTATVTFNATAGGLTLPATTTTVYVTVGALKINNNNLSIQQSDTSNAIITRTLKLSTTNPTPQQYELLLQDGTGAVTINGLVYNTTYTDTTPIFTVSAGNPVTVTVGVDPTAPAARITPGRYFAQLYFFKGTVFFDIPVSADEQLVNLTYDVTGQVLATTPLTVFFAATGSGAGIVPTQTINVSEQGYLTANAAVPISVTFDPLGLSGVSTPADWLRVSPVTTTVPAGGSVPIYIGADPTGLAPGVYQAQVVVQSRNSTTSTVVGVTLRINPQPRLNVSVNNLVFNVPIGSSAIVSQTFTIVPQDAPQSGGVIPYTLNKTAVNWLLVNPVSGTVTQTATISTPATITVSIDPTKFYTDTAPVKIGDAFNARVRVFDQANPDGDPNSFQGIRIPILVNITAGNTYTLPFVSNGAINTVTFVTAQNLSSSSTATAIVQYYNPAGGTITTTTVTIPPNGQAVLQTSTAISSGTYGSAIISSTQPLNVLVTEAATGGTSVTSSAYNVSPSTAAVLYNPIALNGNFNGFTTNTFVYNAGNVTSTGTITYYDQNGTQVSSSDTFTVTPHTGQSFNQAGRTGLANNLSYWSVISGTAGSQLVAQVTENGPNNFLAIFEATPNLSQQLFQPTAYSQAFGSFNTGTAIANPNPSPANVTIKYYDAATGSISATQVITIPANGVGNAYTPNSGVPASFTGSAIISSSQKIVATINEQGLPGSGTYVALSNANRRVGLPAVANGFANFTTGTTLLNVTSQTIQVTLQYYNAAGNPVNPALVYQVLPGASVLAYQGGTGQAALPAGFFGTAVLTSNVENSLVATTNAAAPGLFYTYTEPAQ